MARLNLDKASRSPNRARAFSPQAAAILAGGGVALAAWISRVDSPDLSHPGVRRWYRGLDKPGFTPPEPAFAVAWATIEVLLVGAGYRLLRQPSSRERSEALALLAATVALIPSWTHVFFGQRQLAASLVMIVVHLGVAAGYVVAARRVDGAAAAMGVPLAAWLCLGTPINEEIWRRNAG